MSPPPSRSFSDQMVSDRDSRVDDQRRKHEEERRRRESEMARIRDEERARIRDSEKSRSNGLSITPETRRVDGAEGAATVSIETSSLQVPTANPLGLLRAWAAAVPAERFEPPPLPLLPLPTWPAPGQELTKRTGDITASVRPQGVGAFLALDPQERFDIVALNALPLAGLPAEASAELETLTLVAKRANALADRARQETENPAFAGAFLRERVLEWSRRSASSLRWADETPARWGGIFAESRVPGGKLQPWIVPRLRALRDSCLRSAGWRANLKDRWTHSRSSKKEEERTRYQVLVTEVAQAMLDDLAARARVPEAPLPLVRLSELAQRRDVESVNQALADLFGGSERGPFVVLHPSRYPDCDLLAIRPPPPAARGGMLSYDLVAAKGGVPAAQPQFVIGGSAGASTPISLLGQAAAASFSMDAGGGLWEAADATKEQWSAHLKSLFAQKGKLEAPPKEYRSRPAFDALRQLLLADREVQIAFLATKWRGRPAGLPLLAQLLLDGKLEPKVATDYEYIEAELGDIERGDIGYKPANFEWTIPGWKIKREGDFRVGLRFVAAAT